MEFKSRFVQARTLLQEVHMSKASAKVVHAKVCEPQDKYPCANMSI